MRRRSSIHLAKEAGVAFLASVAFFLLAAVAIPVRDHLVLIFLLGAVYTYVILLAAKRRGPLYAVPLAIAGGLAFDSFYIPPTRAFGAGDWQNWLVVAIYISLGVLIGMLGEASSGAATASALVREALDHAKEATAELRELAHGILPGVLTRGGLRAGVGALASRMSVPVKTDVSVDRLPPAVEATAYFVVAEALTNVAKHAHAEHAAVTAHVEDDALLVRVLDDGVGGAHPEGSGLVGLGDRLAALDGRLRVESPGEGGTLLAATIPLGG